MTAPLTRATRILARARESPIIGPLLVSCPYMDNMDIRTSGRPSPDGGMSLEVIRRVLGHMKNGPISPGGTSSRSHATRASRVRGIHAAGRSRPATTRVAVTDGRGQDEPQTLHLGHQLGGKRRALGRQATRQGPRVRRGVRVLRQLYAEDRTRTHHRAIACARRPGVCPGLWLPGESGDLPLRTGLQAAPRCVFRQPRTRSCGWRTGWWPR